MKNYRKSDYALNKFSEGIVYQFSDGTLEISIADYLRDKVGKQIRISKKSFDEWLDTF